MTFVIDINDVNISKINDQLKTGKYNRLILKNHYNLEDVEILRDLDTSNIEIFDDLFKNCTKLRDISALSNWNINKGKSFKNMFAHCVRLKIIPSDWVIDDKFYDCISLKDYSIKQLEFKDCIIPIVVSKKYRYDGMRLIEIDNE